MGAFDDLLPNCVQHAKAMGEIEKRLEEKIGEKKMKQKLIDADELVAKADCSVEFVSYDNTTYIPYVDYVDEICRAPTVEAIPVKWLERYIDSTLDDDNSQMLGFKAAIIKEMLEEWRKENEVD